jgi:hypothetical protein
MVIGELYVVEEDVGLLPSIVYLIVAPFVEQLIITFCANEYVPPVGLNEGVATCSNVFIV